VCQSHPRIQRIPKNVDGLIWSLRCGKRLKCPPVTCFETSGNMQTEKSWNWWTWHFASFLEPFHSSLDIFFPRRWAPTRWPPVRYPEFPCVLKGGEIIKRYWVWLYSKESQKTIKRHKTTWNVQDCVYLHFFKNIVTVSLLFGRASWVVFPGGEGCAGSVTRQAGQVAVHFLNSGFSAHGTSLQVCLADHKLQQLVGISRSDHKKLWTNHR